MKTIHIVSESAAVGKRLRDILYQEGFSDITFSDLAALPEIPQNAVTVIYAKSNIPGLMQSLSECGGNIILLLNPDCYAMHIDRARHIGITLLLMPVVPYMLLDAVRNAIF